MQKIKSEAVTSAIVESLTKGTTRTAAYRAAGIAERTFYNWIRDDEDFKDQVEEAEASAVSTVEDALFRSATTPNAKGTFNSVAQIFYLCNRSPDNWKNVKDVRHSGGIVTGDTREAVLAALVATGQKGGEDGGVDSSEA